MSKPSSFCSCSNREEAVLALASVITSVCALYCLQPTVRVLHTLRGALPGLGPHANIIGVFFPYSWGAYCYSDFCMTCVELSGSCKTVEGGVELETVNESVA